MKFRAFTVVGQLLQLCAWVREVFLKEEGGGIEASFDLFSRSFFCLKDFKLLYYKYSFLIASIWYVVRSLGLIVPP